MQAKLVVVGGEAKAAEISLKLPTIIGRGRDATLTLPHPLVSRQHCEIFENNGQLFVRDLGSLNGTFIGSQRITEAPLPSGELLTVGTVTFRAVYEQAPLPPDAAPIINTSTPTPRGSATVKPGASPLAATIKESASRAGGTVRESSVAKKITPVAPVSTPQTPAAPEALVAPKAPIAATPDTQPVNDDDILDLLDDEGEPSRDEPPLDFTEEEQAEQPPEEEELDFEEEVPAQPAKPAFPLKAATATPAKPAAPAPTTPPAASPVPVATPATPAAPSEPAPSTKPSDKSGTIFIGPPSESGEPKKNDAASDESLADFFKRIK